METKRGITREVDGDLVLGGNSEHTIKNLRDPQAADEPVTLGYYESHGGGGTPDRIKGGAGTTYDETEIGVGPNATGEPSILLIGKNRGDEFLSFSARESGEGTGWVGWHNSRGGYGRGYVRWTSRHAELYGANALGAFGRVYVDGEFGGNVYFDIPGADAGGGHQPSIGIRLGSRNDHTPNVRSLPSNVNSILHGIKLGVDAHDALASMPAPPELEWWDPVWTPVNNVDSVSNVECQYTRTYRAAGGSLVTLEGTITVEIDADDASTTLVAPLPVPATSTGTLLAPAIGVDLSSGTQAVCEAGVIDDGSGPVLFIEAGPLEGATGVPATLTIGFRVSYRAA